MPKFIGLVGYVTQSETKPGVWTPSDDPKTMRGDIIRQSSSSQNGDKVNSDVSLNHRVSLVGDSYSFGNYYNIRWVEIDGLKWEVSSVEIQRPRIIVTLGGVWNG
jgi:hypothetical protein